MDSEGERSRKGGLTTRDGALFLESRVVLELAKTLSF